MKLISGGQTGVDTAVLAYASENGIPYGGWVPMGRTNEDGVISGEFTGLREAPDSVPATRTRLNVEAADATLILSDGSDSPGTAVTAEFADQLAKPCKSVALGDDMTAAAKEVRQWLNAVEPAVLNIAGPRESEAPGIGKAARRFLRLVLGAQ